MESGVNPELCRNCNPSNGGKSDTYIIKAHSRAGDTSTYFYLFGIGVFILTAEKQTSLESQNPGGILLADSIPSVEFHRDQARKTALERLANNHDNLMEGKFDDVPIAVDVLSEVHKYNEIADKYGEDSNESMQMYEAAYVSSKRAIAEAMRSQTWEYFEPLRFDYDEKNKDFVAFGMSTRDAMLQGLSPISVKEEQARRVEEYVENETHVAHMESDLGEDFWYLTISMCAEHEEAEELGYVPELDKMMLRGVHFGEDESGKYKQLEQVGIPGLEIGDETVKSLLVALGVDTENFDRTELLGTQIMIPKDTFEGVVDIVELLDYLSGKQLFMGEDGVGDYSRVAEQAKARQDKLDQFAHELTQYSIEQDKNGVDPQLAKMMQIKIVTKMAHALAKDDPEVARHAFSTDTAIRYAHAKELEEMGRSSEAASIRDGAVETSGDVSIGCVGGSCGLVGVSSTSAIAARAASMGLEKGQLVSFSKSSCGGCGSKRFVWQLNGNSYCDGCRRARINGKIFGPDKEEGEGFFEAIANQYRMQKIIDKKKKEELRPPLFWIFNS